MTFKTRRYQGLCFFLLAALGFSLVDYSLTTQLHRAALFSGWSLLVMILVLTFFNARKKLPFLPLLTASAWMQIHIYVGLLSVVLFALHLHGRLPHGWLEGVLGLLYLAVAVSGFIGLAISRWLPARLTIHGENLIYERIPALRTVVNHEVAALVEQSVLDTHSSTIADFYETNLRAYFARPRHLLAHLAGYRQHQFRLLAEAEALDRFLNPAERDVMAQIVKLIHAKDNLDFQLAGQRLLKLWLFVHIPLTYSLLLFAIVHVIMAFTLS